MKIEDWEHWIQDIDKIDGLSKIEKEKAKESFQTISEFFNLDIPTLAKNRHPIINDIVNTAPWTRQLFIHLAEALRTAQLQVNWEQNFKKLKKPDLYFEGLLELDIANAFVQVGFKVEFYPIVKKINKIPDLKIVNPETNEQFFIEVTNLQSSDQAKESSKTFDVISKRLFVKSWSQGKYLNTMGRVHKALSEPNLKRILNKIDEILEKASKSGFEELVEENLIELGVATDNKKDLLAQWAKDRKIENAFSGPSWNTDEAHRIQQKIRKKQQQLPKNLLNLLVIKDQTGYLMGRHDITDIGRLEEYVYDHEHLALCIIFNSYIGGSSEDKIQMFGEHIRLEKSSDLRTREILILTNKFITDKTITPNSISKLKQAFLESRAFLI